jgi:transcription elongation factor GreA
MSEVKKYIMTYQGVKKLEEELEFLKTVKRNNRKLDCFRLWNLSENSDMMFKMLKHLQKEEFFN